MFFFSHGRQIYSHMHKNILSFDNHDRFDWKLLKKSYYKLLRWNIWFVHSVLYWCKTYIHVLSFLGPSWLWSYGIYISSHSSAWHGVLGKPDVIKLDNYFRQVCSFLLICRFPRPIALSWFNWSIAEKTIWRY